MLPDNPRRKDEPSMNRWIPVCLVLLLTACGGGSNSTPTTPSTPTPTPPAAPTVTAVTVTGTGCSNGVCVGQAGNTMQLTATAELSNNTTQDVTNQAQWTST